MGRLPYSTNPFPGTEEKDSIYHNTSQQNIPINQQYSLINSPFVKNLHSIDFSALDTDEKLKLIFDTLHDTQTNTYNLLTALLVVLIIILFKIITKK